MVSRQEFMEATEADDFDEDKGWEVRAVFIGHVHIPGPTWSSFKANTSWSVVSLFLAMVSVFLV